MAAVTLFVALVAQFGVVAHMGIVRHDVCAEDGDLIELDRPLPESQSPQPSRGPLPGHHEHCPLAAHPCTFGPPVAGIDGTTPLDRGPQRETAQPPTTKLTSLVPLSLAPKTSPPRV